MAISLNQAYDIAQKLSNEQLMQAYTNGTLPQFVLFSEMELRQKEQKNRAQAPTQTVAERLVGAPPESSGIMQAAPEVPPQTAARGGIARSSPLDMGYSEDLPQEAKKIISMRLKAMRELEEEPQYAAEGGQLESQIPAPATDNKPLTSRELADMLLHPVMMTESGGRQSAVSPKGAIGMMQIMPETGPEAAKIAGVQWDPKRFKTDADYNTRLGHAYLTSMIDRFGDTEKALAAYNMGPTRLSGVLERAKRTGTDWKTMIPRETQGYLGKILGSRQSLLPPRQTPEGADAEVPARYGNDPAFGGFLIRDSGYKYPRQDNSVDKGLAALRSAQAVQGVRFNRGGPVYLQNGSEDETVVGDYIPQDYGSYSSDESREPESGGMSVWQERERAINALKRRMPQMSVSPELSGERVTPTEQEQPTSSRAGRFFSDIYGRVKGFVNQPDLASKYPRIQALQEERDRINVGPFTQETELQKVQREKRLAEIEKEISAIMAEKPADFEDPRVVSAERGIPSAKVPDQADTSGFGMTDWQSAAAGIPSVSPRGTTPPGAAKPPAGAGGAGGGGAGGAGEDQSFAQIMKQVQDTIGSKIPDEMKDQMKKYQENLASMKNDKLVDALSAAAKTLAGQRRGSVNFADAVANAGLAAQEAQKRIYKADDDMRKYRGELLKAQQDGDYKAATIAMNRLVEGEKSKRAMQTAIAQTNRLIQSQESAERRTNISSIYGLIGKLETQMTSLAKPGQPEYDPQKTEAERRRLQGELQAAKNQLLYYQTGLSGDEVRAEVERRRAEAARRTTG